MTAPGRLRHGRLAFGLAALIVAVGTRIGTDRRQMDKVRDTLLCRDPRDAARALGLDGIKGVPAGPVQDAHAVHDRIRTSHGRAHRSVVADIAQDRLHLTDGAIGFDEKRLVRASHGHAHAPAEFRHPARDLPPDKTRSAVDGDEPGHGNLRKAARGPD